MIGREGRELFSRKTFQGSPKSGPLPGFELRRHFWGWVTGRRHGSQALGELLAREPHGGAGLCGIQLGSAAGALDGGMDGPKCLPINMEPQKPSLVRNVLFAGSW